jgi:hypothetical protein
MTLVAMTMGLMTAGASPAAAALVTSPDDGGPNDLNSDGQNDLTQFGRDDDDPDFLTVTWSWDEPSALTGAGQTVNACALFDTDSDGLVDNAFCVEVSEDPPGTYVVTDSGSGTDSTKDYPTWVGCTEGGDDRCKQAAGGGRIADPYLGGLEGSTCTVVVSDSDPFPGAGDDDPKDLVATCQISYDLIGDGELVNVCSYSSAANDGNNNPFDCVISPGSARLTIIKDAGDDTTTEFVFTSDTAAIDGDTQWSVTGSGEAVASESFEVLKNGKVITLTEAIPDGWQLEAASCLDGEGSPTGTTDLDAGTISGVQLDPLLTTVCTFTNGPAIVAPITTVIKGSIAGNDTVATVAEPGGSATIDVAVTNNAPAGTGDATLTSLLDVPHGDITTTGHDGITGTTCATGQTIVGGATYTCSFTVDVAGSPAELTDTLTATLTNTAGSDSDSDQATVEITDIVPTISVTKTASPDEVPETGGEVTYTYTVRNTTVGEAVTIATLTDDRFPAVVGDGDCEVGTVLAAGASCTFTHSATLAADDLTPHVNTITVTASDDDGNTAEAEDSATVTFADVQPQVTITKTADPASIPEPEGQVGFTIELTNTTAEETSIDSLVDTDFDLATLCATPIPATLAGNGDYTCTFTTTIVGNVGDDHENTATVTFSDDDGNGGQASDDATVVIDGVDPLVTVAKDGPATVDEGGATATYTITITNDSVASDPVTVTALTDDRFGSLLAEAEAANGGTPIVLDPDEEFSFEIDRELELDAGQDHVNTVTVTVEDDEGVEATDDDDHTVTGVDLQPTITVVKTAGQAEIFAPGEMVTFTVVVTNTSNAADPVEVGSLVDDIHGGVACLDDGDADIVGQTIAPGDSVTCTFEVEVDATETDTVTVVATDGDGNQTQDSGQATVEMLSPSIDIEKSTNGADADAAPGPSILAGDPVQWTYLVTNTGDVDLIDIEVTDSEEGPIACPAPTLTAGTSMTCTASGTAEAGSYQNTGYVTSRTVPDVDGDQVIRGDSDLSHYTGVVASLAVTKTADVSTVDAAGDEIVFTIEVVNDGDLTVVPTVADVLSGGAIGGPGGLAQAVTGPFTDATFATPVANPGDGLAPDGTWYYRAAYTVTQADLDAGATLSNQACVQDVDPGDDDECDTSIVTIDQRAELTIDKRTNGQDGPQLKVLDAIEWTYEVENTGNVTVSGIDVTDDQGVVVTCPDLGPDLALAPGESTTCTATGNASYHPSTDPYVNIGSATGEGPPGGPDPAEATDESSYNGLYWAFTPGFWKNHNKGVKRNVWNALACGFDGSTKLGQLFALDGLDYEVAKAKGKGKRALGAGDPLERVGLHDALSLQGGSDENGAAETLMRAAVASLLNSCFHETLGNPVGPDGVWPYSVGDLTSVVDEALLTRDRRELLALAAQLDRYNNGIHEIDWSDPVLFP